MVDHVWSKDGSTFELHPTRMRGRQRYVNTRWSELRQSGWLLYRLRQTFILASSRRAGKTSQKHGKTVLFFLSFSSSQTPPLFHSRQTGPRGQGKSTLQTTFTETRAKYEREAEQHLFPSPSPPCWGRRVLLTKKTFLGDDTPWVMGY